jgi:hypothetical protein
VVEETAWVEALAAAGPKEASREKREDFANAVISRLPGAYERGRFAENAFEIRKRFAAASESLRLSLMSFHDMVATDPVAAAHLGFNLGELGTVAGPLYTYLEQVARCGADQEYNDAYSFRKPPGRKIRIAIEIAEMVALAYYQHFGKMPGKSKQATVNTPFFQVCRVVRRILRACGHTGFSIGDEARNSGIERAKVMVECLAIIRGTQPDTK